MTCTVQHLFNGGALGYGSPDEPLLYCTEPLPGNQRPEHVLPASIGAELVTTSVCDCCNTRAGREIDQPWLQDPLVLPLRVMHEVRDRRDQKVRPKAVKTKLEDGRDVLVYDLGDRAEIKPLPRVVVDESAGTILIEAMPDDAEKIAKRLEAKYPDAQWKPDQPGPGGPTHVTIKYEPSIEAWPRFAAKVTLATVSLVNQDEWIDTDTAHKLRAVLWAGARESRPLQNAGFAWSAIPLSIDRASSPGNLLQVGEHLLCFESQDDGGAALSIIVFGTLLYRVRLPRSELPAVPPAWFFDAHAGTVERVPWQILSMQLTHRRGATSGGA